MKYCNEGLVLRKDSITLRTWDGDAQEYVEKPTQPLNRLWTTIGEIADDFTLRDLFNIIKPHAEAWEEIIQEYVEAIIDDMDAEYPPEEEDVDGVGMKYLEVNRYLEVTIDRKTGEKELSQVLNFHGQGTQRLRGGQELPEGAPDQIVETGYAICLSPIPHLADYPLRYNPECHMTVDFKTTDKFVVSDIKLLEFVHQIFWELTFHGKPSQRNEENEELSKSIEDIMSGDVETIPFDISEYLDDDEEEDIDL